MFQFNRRRSDTSDTGQDQDFVYRLKQFTITLLQSFKTFSLNLGNEKTVQQRQILDSYIDKLRSVDSVEALQELEIQVKHLIYSQHQAENLRNAQRLNALQKLITAAASNLSELAGDSEQFADLLNKHLRGLEVVLSHEELQSFRERLEQEINSLRHLVEEKQKREKALTESLRQRVKVLEEQLAAANEELVIDALTQVYNRRAFDAQLEEEIKHHTAHGGHFSLLIFDIDYFKQVNDTHGHLVGDRVLRAVAQTAKKTFRIDDFVARYGGEEFAVLLYDTGELYMNRAAERFRAMIAARQFQYQQGGTTRSLRITVSIGAACFRPGDTPESLIERADRALYLAKHSGRNCVKTEKHLK